MKSDSRAPKARDPRSTVASLVSIAFGVAISIRLAFTAPVFHRLALDIPLYLTLGLSLVVLMLGAMWAVGVAIGRERLWREGRVTATGWGVAAFGFIAASCAGAFAVMFLSNLS